MTVTVPAHRPRVTSRGEAPGTTYDGEQDRSAEGGLRWMIRGRPPRPPARPGHHAGHGQPGAAGQARGVPAADGLDRALVLQIATPRLITVCNGLYGPARHMATGISPTRLQPGGTCAAAGFPGQGPRARRWSRRSWCARMPALGAGLGEVRIHGADSDPCHLRRTSAEPDFIRPGARGATRPRRGRQGRRPRRGCRCGRARARPGGLPASARYCNWSGLLWFDGFGAGPGACLTLLPAPDRCRVLRAAGRVKGRGAPA